MRLAKLTLAGFKSFADVTTFEFDLPITAIVGPNGCGKSNVVDAIKWVLGERSAKSLRGKEMADVIFAGSAGRKPGGLASVTLTFDNPVLTQEQAAMLDAGRLDELDQATGEMDPAEGEEPPRTLPSDADDTPVRDDAGVVVRPRAGGPRRWLPVESPQVDVERRLYRDGVSQYLINGRKVRLRDIRELFMDTGVGAHAYSIIEQGKVDAMLIANPVERRVFFEEAAGVAKFKARRLEAKRRLERTENNLVRTREQLESAERRLRIVKGQAAKAEKFRGLDAELWALRAASWFDQYDELLTRITGLTSRLSEVHRERREARSALEEAEQAKQQAELERSELAGQRSRTDRERTAAEHRGEQARQRAQMIGRALAEAEEQLAAERERAQRAATQLEQLAEQAEAEEQSAAQLREAAIAAEQTLETATTQRAELQERLARDRRELAERRASAAAAERERSAVEARIQSDRRRLEQVRAERERLETRGRALAAERDEFERERRESASAFESADGSASEISERIGETLRHAESLSDDQRTLTERLNELEQRHARLDSRREALVEMIDSREGMGEAVRDLMTARDAAGGSGSLGQLIGPLGELIEVDRERAEAVEAALGTLIEAVVVDGGFAELSAIAAGKLPGRVTLLPTRSAGPPGELDAELIEVLASVPGRVTPLASVVRTRDERVRRVLTRLLGRTMLVGDVDSASLLAAGPMAGRGCRFVTTEGTVIEADARIIAGPRTTGEGGAGVLARRSERAELETQLSVIEGELVGARSRRADLDARASALNDELETLRRGLADRERERQAAESRRDRFAAQLERVARELPALEQEIAGAGERAKAIERERYELGERAAELREQGEQHAHAVSELEAATLRAQAELDQAGERVSALRTDAGRSAERLATAERELRRLGREREEAEAARLRLVQDAEQREAKIEAHRAVIEEAEQEIRASAADVDRLGATLVELSERLGSAIERADALGEELGQIRKRTDIIERDWQSLEMSRRELEVRRESLEEKASDEIDLDLAGEIDEYRAIIAPGDVAPIDREAADRRITELREAIRKLGNVNLDAIAEAEELVGQNQRLTQQVADIDAAREQLETLITRLADASRDRFREVFSAIQANFSGHDGMFRKLFGGGKAELRLLPVTSRDEEGNLIVGEPDWLESGIDVMAKPPGKEPRSISQLSGGEKTMTAVALLMSIFQSKPSPFCVLDEVDAALDDANVERFTRIVRAFLDQCHFIVITHNKKTMQSADALFGVTQQERGVSTRVPVRFDQVQAGGEIELKRREPALGGV